MNKRIIPCLDIQDGYVVKGKQFQNIKRVADPIEFATKYEQAGADVLFMLDIDGKNREKFLQIVQKVANTIHIPLYVGGGIRTIADMKNTLKNGADKVAITSAAIDNRDLLKEANTAIGNDALILSIDAKKVSSCTWHAFTAGGRVDSGLDAVDWAKLGETEGASEILLNSIDADGVKKGYDIALNTAVAEAVDIPVIASGGAGKIEDFQTVLQDTGVDAALAASVFHYDDINIATLKDTLEKQKN